MNNSGRRARTDRLINARIGPIEGDGSAHSLDFPAKINNLEATTRMILDASRWTGGTAVYELRAIKINHQLGEMDDPRACLTTGISSHPQITSDGNGYRAAMPNGSLIPEECITCVISALLSLSGGVKDVPVQGNLL